MDGKGAVTTSEYILPLMLLTSVNVMKAIKIIVHRINSRSINQMFVLNIGNIFMENEHEFGVKTTCWNFLILKLKHILNF